MIDGTNETLRFKSILKLIGFDQLKIVEPGDEAISNLNFGTFLFHFDAQIFGKWTTYNFSTTF